VALGDTTYFRSILRETGFVWRDARRDGGTASGGLDIGRYVAKLAGAELALQSSSFMMTVYRFDDTIFR